MDGFNNLVKLACLGDSQRLNLLRVVSGVCSDGDFLTLWELNAFFQFHVRYELCGKGSQKWLLSRHDLTNRNVIGHFHSDSLIKVIP